MNGTEEEKKKRKAMVEDVWMLMKQTKANKIAAKKKVKHKMEQLAAKGVEVRKYALHGHRMDRSIESDAELKTNKVRLFQQRNAQCAPVINSYHTYERSVRTSCKRTFEEIIDVDEIGTEETVTEARMLLQLSTR